MKKIYLLSFIIIILSITVQSAPVLLQNDNGTIKDSYPVRTNWEETVYLIPNGPCSVEEIQIYFVGEFPNSDTLFIVGDPSEGAVPPTLWCQPYNNKIMPIEFEYDGKPGWRTFKVNGLRSDGFDPFVIQHRIRENGCMFAVDNNGLSSPVRSWLMNPLQQNSLGGPGQYYYADGDYLVRVLVNYDLPDGNTSQPPPPPVLTDITKDAGLVNTSGNPINATEASVVDWNNDGFDDIAIGGNFFQNNGDGTFKNVTSAMKISAGATSWADIDNDGDLDVYALVGGSYNQAATMVNNQSKVYKNNGDGSFTVILNKDLFRLPYPSPGKEFNSLQYDQDSVPNPYSCITPLLLDANGDGRLDIFFANNRVGFNNSSNQSEERYFPDKLWLQDNSGQFYDVTAGSGIAAGEPFSPGTLWFGYYDCYGANACDYNLDNKTDIFVANYRLAKDNLYQNTGGGTFTEAAASTGVQGVLTPCQIPGYFGHGMGAEWADFNNDGYPDLCVGNLGHPDWRGANSNSSLIFKNNGPQGNYSFEEVHDVLGLKFFEMNAGVLWADLDLDGFQDLWHGQISYYTEGSNGEPRRRGHFYRNEGPPDYKLSDMTWYWGSNIHGPWCAARIDFDHDGDLDVLVCSSHKGALLFRNDLPHLGNWLAFRISGNPADNVPMDGIGTKIIVYAGNQKFYRDLQGSAAGSRCLQNSFELHFGLGQVTPDSVVVIYPNGKRNKLTGIAVNQRYRIPYMQNAMPYSLATPALVAPKNFAIRVSQIDKLKWTTCSGAEKYMIQIADDNKFVKIVINDSTANNEYLAMSLESNRTYYWRVMAKSSGVQSLWSSVWNFTLGVPRPNAPTLLSPADASKNQPSQPQFQWSESTYNINYNFITKYDFQISSDNQFINYVIEYNNLTVTKLIIDSVLTASVTYYWRVRGTNESQPGEWSQPWSFVTGPLPAKPTLTEPANDAKDLTLKPTFRWSGETGSTGYEIQISKDSQFNSNAFEKSQMKLNRLTLTDPLDINTKYYWHIRTHNEFGAGQWSDSWSFTTGNGTGVEDYYTTQDKFAITAIIPNPFSEKTTIHFQMYIAGEIILSIYDLTGCEVFSGKYHFTEGEHFIDWQPDNLSKGLYIFRIRSGFHEEAGKLMFY